MQPLGTLLHDLHSLVSPLVSLSLSLPVALTDTVRDFCLFASDVIHSSITASFSILPVVHINNYILYI